VKIANLPGYALIRALAFFAFCGLALCIAAQNSPNERAFPQSKVTIERALKSLQPSVAGRLPLLEGFVVPGDRGLDRFTRAYYQCAVQVSSVPSGGSLVRVNAKITAWYADPVASHSGYQVLPSNGRLEADLLDQIADSLNRKEVRGADSKAVPSAETQPSLSAPMPRLPDGSIRGAVVNRAPGDATPSLKAQTDAAEKHEQELANEAKGLEEILQNQSHPTDLVAVKTSGTPVLQSPNAEGKILFPATAGDEFELLDANSNWVHVRISGLSRGWIRRSALEMPEGAATGKPQSGGSSPDTAEEFKLSNEQLAPFPGDWEPLRGKIVKILTVQKTNEGAKSSGPRAKLLFAKTLLQKRYAELAATENSPAGIVLIFDSDDGGMLAATSATLKEWQASSVPDETIWRQCFFDPPEVFADTK
jgi:hypothetical protein